MPLTHANKIALLAALYSNNGNISKTARETGYARKTIRHYRDTFEKHGTVSGKPGFKTNGNGLNSGKTDAFLNDQSLVDFYSTSMIEQELAKIRELRFQIYDRLAVLIPETKSLSQLAKLLRVLTKIEIRLRNEQK